jgi:hypothetical protein
MNQQIEMIKLLAYTGLELAVDVIFDNPLGKRKSIGAIVISKNNII